MESGGGQLMPLACFMVNNVSTSTFEQCKFLIENNCLESESFIDYVYLVYCDLGHELRPLAILLVISLVILIFIALSAVADEFLCTSLLAVSRHLRMSDSLAGVTLLAFGNGCPDIFSSLAAANDDRPELIVGELLGAGIFCTSIVSGLIFIHSDFKLACRPILRDATFYLLAVYLIWSYCWMEHITFYGSLAFIIIYVIYLTVALSGQAINSRLQGNYAIAQIQADNELYEERSGNWFQRSQESLRKRGQVDSGSKRHHLGETDPLTPGDRKISRYNNNHITSIHIGTDQAPTGAAVPLEVQLYSSVNSNSNNSNSNHNKCHPTAGCNNKAFAFDSQTTTTTMAMTTPPNDYADFGHEPGDRCRRHATEQHKQQQQRQPVVRLNSLQQSSVMGSELNLNEWDDFLAHINPINLEGWREIGLAVKLLRLLKAPIMFAALMTVPLVDEERRRNNWCRLLNALHCVTVPLFVLMATPLGGGGGGSTFQDQQMAWGLPLPVVVLVPSLLLAAIILVATNSYGAPKYHALFAYAGFIMSVMWIYLLASEMISLLKTIGIMFSMTDTAIGLGILAWGNSLGDIVSNLSLAEAGYPRMAIGACIGAPLLNLLLGFGLSFTLSLKPGASSQVEYSPTITLLCSTLTIILVSLMLATLAPPEKSRKNFGYLLILGYGLYFSLAVCLEYGLINF